MSFIKGANRNQLLLFPQSLEEYILAENPVRANPERNLSLVKPKDQAAQRVGRTSLWDN
jgi:hypothetical protein